MRYINYYASPLGRLLLASESGTSLSGLWFEGGRFTGDILAVPFEERDLLVFEETAKWLDIYFSGHEPEFMPAISFPDATDFRVEVWHRLLEIPYGATVSYNDIALSIASRKGAGKVSARAVGGAVGHNPISIIVPCHRVIGADGSLTGYAGGLGRKVALLELEGVKKAP